MEQLLYIVEALCFIYLAFNIAYLLLFALLGCLYKETIFKDIEIKIENRFVVLVPAFKHDAVILQTIEQNLKQDYPKDKHDFIVIADSLLPATIGELIKKNIKVIEVQFDESNKAKSINFALNLLSEKDYDYCLLLDIDNIMEPAFISKINTRLQNQEIAIQGHRTAKNLNSSLAILDAVSEEINNHIFRKGHAVSGLSAALIGSGQVIAFKTYKQLMLSITSAVEDKELEFALTKLYHRVLYENNALVYDEKVQNAGVFINQRKRWIASQFFDIKLVIYQGLFGFLKKGDFNFLDRVFQRLLLPRVLLLGISFFSAFLVFVPFFHFGSYYLYLFFACCFGFLISMPATLYNSKTLLAALRLPEVFILMVLATIRSKGASKKFIHTIHQLGSNDFGAKHPLKKK